MQLITTSTTLVEFESAESLCIKDPTTNSLCIVFLKKNIGGGTKRFVESTPHSDGRPCKYLRVNSGNKNIVVANADRILALIKGGDFIFDC